MRIRTSYVPICRTLAGIVPPRDAVAYQVADLDSRKPAWGPIQPLPAQQEPARLPARVRFVDRGRRCRWGFVRVDPAHPEAKERVGVLLLDAYLRAIDADRKWRRTQRAMAGRGGSLTRRVEQLEAAVAALSAQREETSQ